MLDHPTDAGYGANAAHYSGHTFKTDAPLEEVLELMGWRVAESGLRLGG